MEVWVPDDIIQGGWTQNRNNKEKKLVESTCINLLNQNMILGM